MTAGPAETFDAVVVGGGIVGLAVAHAVRERGLRVVVLDAAEPGREASWVSAGMLAPTSEAAFGEEDVLRANVASAALWPDWAAALGVPLRAYGSLMVARDRDEAEALEREAAYRESLGLGVERLLPSAARRLEPALAPTLRAALDVPGDLAVDPRAVTAALLASGLDVRTGARVARVEAPGTAVLESGERVRGERLVLAAGAWSAALVAGVPVRPVKGQILRLRDPDGPGLVERVVRMADGYLVPRDDGTYVLGASVEEQGFDTRVTAGPVSELLRDAIELIPGLAELELAELSAGLRPGTPDNAPVIGARPDGVVLATGHYRHGVLLTPLTAGWVAAELAGERPEIPAAFAPGRFAEVAA